MWDITLGWILYYIRLSLCVGVINVIITSIEKTEEYHGVKDRVKRVTIVTLFWPAILIYSLYDDIQKLRRK